MGTETTTKNNSFDKYYESAALSALQKMASVANLGVLPNPGQQVASLADPTKNAMAMSKTWSDTFMNPSAGTTIDTARAGVEAAQPASYVDPVTGIRGTSGMPGFEDRMAALGEKYPGALKYLKGMFMDPVTGQLSDFWSTPLQVGKGKAKKIKKQLGNYTIGPDTTGSGGVATGTGTRTTPGGGASYGMPAPSTNLGFGGGPSYLANNLVGRGSR